MGVALGRWVACYCQARRDRHGRYRAASGDTGSSPAHRLEPVRGQG
jgi:hypothetical protein